MEKSRMITRSLHRQLSGEKAGSDCAAGVRNRGSKRQHQCRFCQGPDCLGQTKRKKMPKDGSAYLAVKDLRSRRIFSPSGMKPTDGSSQAGLQKGKQIGFDSSASGASKPLPGSEDCQIVVTLPVSQRVSDDIARAKADAPCIESQDGNVSGHVMDSESLGPEIENRERQLSLDEAFRVPENEEEQTPSPFKPFDLVLEMDTDSEDFPSGPEANDKAPPSPRTEGAGSPEGKSVGDCNAASSNGFMNEISECASQVFDKMSHRESLESSARREGSPFKMSAEEESPRADAETGGISMDLHPNNEACKKQGGDNAACRPELSKGMVASGPSSRWLFSGSRFAAFLRSHVGISEPGNIESASKLEGRVPAREIGGVLGSGGDSAPAKAQLNKSPPKRKVALSPSSQLRLLQTSNIGSYRRMMPFCNELAKDLAKASETQAIKNSLSSTDCMAPKEDGGHPMEVLSSESLPADHVKPAQNESQSEPSLSHLEPPCTSYTNGPTIQNSMPRIHCVSPKEHDAHAIKILNDEAVSMEDVKPELKECQSEPPSTHPEAQAIQNPLPLVRYIAPEGHDNHTVEAMSSKSLSLEHVNHEQNGIQLEQHLGWLELSSTCHPEAQTIKNSVPGIHLIASKDNDAHAVEVLARESVSLGHSKSEENGLWLEPSPSQLVFPTDCHPKAQSIEESLSNIHCRTLQEYDMPSVEVSNSISWPMQHVKSEQNGALLESPPRQLEPFSGCHAEVQTTENSLLTAYSMTAESCDMSTIEVGSGFFCGKCVKPKQNEGQIEVSRGLLETVPIQLEPHPSCYLVDSSNTLERQVLMDPLGTDSLLMLPSKEECSSPIQMQKDLASDGDNMPLFDLKFPTTTSPGSADSTCFFTPAEIPSPLDTPVSVPSKGILKVSPRSCKGVCTCPDCASFRFQAEKASDFCLRQLRVMELLGMTLMNELNNMRKLIEKSLVAVPQGVGRHAIISYSEVKGASTSALKAEERAKNYLMQMARDCNLHRKIMRMQQRRVKFADRIEVKLFKSE